MEREIWLPALNKAIHLACESKHGDYELETPTLSYAAIAALLHRLESSAPRDRP